MAELIQTKRELARRLKLSETALYKHLGKMGAPKKQDGGFDLEKVEDFILGEQGKNEAGTPEYKDVSYARTLKIIAEYQKLKLQIDEMSGKLVNKAEITARFVRWAQTTRNMMLSLPNKLASRLASAKTDVDVSRILKDEIDKTLSAISQIDGDNPTPAVVKPKKTIKKNRKKT